MPLLLLKPLKYSFFSVNSSKFSYVYVILSIDYVYVYISYFVYICHPPPLITNLLCGVLFTVYTGYVLVSMSTVTVVLIWLTKNMWIFTTSICRPVFVSCLKFSVDFLFYRCIFLWCQSDSCFVPLFSLLHVVIYFLVLSQVEVKRWFRTTD
jgi:hypothetical protein